MEAMGVLEIQDSLDIGEGEGPLIENGGRRACVPSRKSVPAVVALCLRFFPWFFFFFSAAGLSLAVTAARRRHHRRRLRRCCCAWFVVAAAAAAICCIVVWLFALFFFVLVFLCVCCCCVCVLVCVVSVLFLRPSPMAVKNEERRAGLCERKLTGREKRRKRRREKPVVYMWVVACLFKTLIRSLDCRRGFFDGVGVMEKQRFCGRVSITRWNGREIKPFAIF